jgi:poly(3-hydroxybutyrate) depolymerase
MNIKKSITIFLVLFLFNSSFSQIDSMQIGNLWRTFIVYAPNGISNPPLVVNMHGLGSNASQQRIYTQFDVIANREKFIVVYPNGINNSWDLSGTRDVIIILALIDTIDQKYKIDRSRIYATGFSMGGFMSHKLACEASSTFAAIASAGLNVTYNCSPVQSISVMQIHGTADNIVPYSGVAATINGWISNNGCTNAPQVISPYPLNNSNSNVTKEWYKNCKDNSEVVLLRIENGGHSWPGALGQSSSINASEEIWNFFKNHATSSNTKKHVFNNNISKITIFTNVSANNRILIPQITNKITEIYIFNLKGQRIKNFFIKQNNQQNIYIDISMKEKCKGTYFVVFKSNDRLYIQKFILN